MASKSPPTTNLPAQSVRGLNTNIDPATDDGYINLMASVHSTDTDTVKSWLAKLKKDATKINVFNGTKILYGICLEVLNPEANQQVMVKSPTAAWKTNASVRVSGMPLRRIRVMIPEIDRCAIMGVKNIYKPTEKDKKVLEFYTLFQAANYKVSGEAVRPGDLVQVSMSLYNPIENKYLGVVERNFYPAVMTEPGAADAAGKFLCQVSRESLKTLPPGSLETNGLVIKAGSGKDGKGADPASAYVVYLYDVEQKFLKDFKEYDKKKIADICYRWGDGVSTVMTEPAASAGEATTIPYEILYAMLYYACALSPIGLINKGKTSGTPDEFSAKFGMGQITKDLFDSYKLIHGTENDPALSPPQAGTKPLTKGFEHHSQLIDPAYAIEFFAKSFESFLYEQTGKGAGGPNGTFGFWAPNSLGLIPQQLISTFLQARLNINFNKSEFKSSGAPDQGRWDTLIWGFKGDTGAPPAKLTSGITTFMEWRHGSKIDKNDPDQATLVKESTPIGKKTENAQGPDAKKAQTPEECHSNYPPENEYYIHIDLQKAKMRKYINSKLSGKKLKEIEIAHRGVKNVMISGLPTPSPFKVVRFDGTAGYEVDKKRWFDASNTDGPDGVWVSPAGGYARPLLKSKERYHLGYYRQPHQITHCVLYTCSSSNANQKYFYKNFCHTSLYPKRRYPHFIIAPDGQIVQLVDIAAVTNYTYNSPSQAELPSLEQNSPPLDEYSITIAFGEGTQIGTMNNNARIDYVGVKKLKQEEGALFSENIKYHKIGTRAALESAHKLIQFLTSITGIKYNLAAQDVNIALRNLNKANIYANGQLSHNIDGMNFIYYAWTYGVAIKNGGKNVLFEDFIEPSA